MINLHINPRKIVDWRKFCVTHPPYSIALDGYVYGPPRFLEPTQGGPKANFNHHEDVDRLVPRHINYET